MSCSVSILLKILMDANCRCSQGSSGSQVGVWPWFCWWHCPIDTGDLQLLLELIVKEGEVADEDQHQSGKGSVHSRGGLLPQVEEFKYLWCLFTQERRKEQEIDDRLVSILQRWDVLSWQWKGWCGIKWSVSIPSWSWLFMGSDGKNTTTNGSSWDEFPPSGWAHSQRDQSQTERRGGACWGGPGVMAAAKMSFWGGTSHPDTDTGDAEGITHPINSWNALELWEKIVGLSLLTSDPYKQRKMEQNPIKPFLLVN